MKTSFLFIAIMAFCANAAFAQTYEVQYTYDKESGNRIERRLVDLDISVAKKNTEAVEEHWGERLITVYPNPTEGELSIKIEDPEAGKDYVYYLFNSSGQLLQQGGRQGTGTLNLSLSAYKSGIYFLQLIDGGEKLNYRIFKK